MTNLSTAARRQMRRIVSSLTGTAPISPLDAFDPDQVGHTGLGLRRLVQVAARSAGVPFEDVPEEFLTAPRTYPEIKAMFSSLVSRQSVLRERFPQGYESDETLELPRRTTDWEGEPLEELPPHHHQDALEQMRRALSDEDNEMSFQE